MKRYAPKYIFALCLVFGLGAWAPGSVGAQQSDYQRWLLNQSQGSSSSSTRVRNKRTERLLEEYHDQVRAQEAERRFSIPEPITTPQGELIVAQAGSRAMTMGELSNRVMLRLKSLPSIRHPDPERENELRNEQSLKLAGELLDEWAEASVLSQIAKRAGTEVTQAEIDEALNQLAAGGISSAAAGSGRGGGGAMENARLLGIPERQLRGELRDALLTEKYVMELIRNHNTTEDYRRIYEINPRSFQLPARVHGYHVFVPLAPGSSEGERKQLRKKLRKLYKMLRKEEPDYEAITAAAAQMDITAVDMGWLSGSVDLPRQIYSALFDYEVGSVSPVFEERDAVHILRVLEREGGSGTNFEASIPQIENYLFAKTRNSVYETNRLSFRVQTNVGGLARWREVSEEEYRQYMEAGQEPAPRSTRRRRAPVGATAQPQAPAKPEGPKIDLSVLGKKPDLP